MKLWFVNMSSGVCGADVIVVSGLSSSKVSVCGVLINDSAEARLVEC